MDISKNAALPSSSFNTEAKVSLEGYRKVLVQEYNESRKKLEEELRESDRMTEEFSFKDDTDGEDVYSSSISPASSQQSQPSEKHFSKRSKRQAELVEQVLENVNLLMTENGLACVYLEKEGYFKNIPNVQVFLAGLFSNETMAELDVRDIQDIVTRLFWREKIRCNLDSFNYYREMVNLENGALDLDYLQFMVHRPDFRFTYVIHASYQEDTNQVSCPVFDHFCKTSLDGDPDKRKLLLEFIGYICSDTNDGKCAMFLKGQPNSGKSVISAFITRLFDQELITNIPLHQLSDRFFRAELAGKKLNVAGEVAGRALKDISIFKSITGNDRITGESKGRDPFYFTPRCKLLFSGNTLPLTTETDTTTAFINRIRVLLFNVSVAPENQDKGLLDKLWLERDSIVTLALLAAHDLAARNYVFTLPEDSKKFLESFQLRGNLITAFIEECCELAPDAKVFNVDLYAAFIDFCARNGLERLSRHKFYKCLSGIPNVSCQRIRISKENRQGHIGITLKEPYKIGTLEQ